jgi:hypothetical protein
MSPQPKIQRLKIRGSYRPVDWASVFTEILVRVLSNSAEKMRWFPIMHEPYIVASDETYVSQEY